MISSPLSVVIRRGAVGSLGELLADGRISAGGHLAVAVGPGQGESILSVVGPALRNADTCTVTEGSVEEARRLADWLRGSSYDAVVGIGGGRTLDVAKYAAGLAGLPMVAVATNLAHDGLASPVASLTSRGRKGSYGVPTPLAVLVDLDYVRASPPRQIRSGVGDALSNLSAIADWELAARERGEPVDGLAVAFARSAGESLLHRTGGLDSDAFLTTLAEALVLSGLAMAVAGSSRPCSGACHEISHAMNALYPDLATHGEQVALGALYASYLRASVLGAADLFAPLSDAVARYGLPRTPAELGLSEDQFVAAVLAAPATRPGRWTVLEHLDLDEAQVRESVRGFLAASH